MTKTTMVLCAPVLWIALTGIAGTANAGEVAAQVGNKKITLEEVDAKALALDVKPYQQLYEVRRAAIDALVADKLLELEAKTRGITTAELIEKEISQRITTVTETEVQTFYDANKARMGGRPIEQVKAQIKGFLSQQNEQKIRQSFLDDLKKKAKVSIHLEPPRNEVRITEHDPSRGPADAPIQIVEFSEFQCPFCSRVGPAIKQVLETYGDRVRLVFRDYPLAFHNNAAGAAEAGQCAHAQGKFWEYHDKLFENQQSLDVENLKKFASELGLDTEAFNTCLDSGSSKPMVDEDFQDGQRLGVRGTPAFFINGRFLSGAQPFEAFKTIIDEELQR